MIRVRNLRKGEQATLSSELCDTGMAYLIPEWVWVVEPASLLGPFAPSAPFAVIVASQAHSWLVLWRVLAISPLPSAVPLNWFLEALPQVFAEARLRGCIGFLTLLADNRPEEVKMARIIARMAQGAIKPFQGSLGAGLLPGIELSAPEIEALQATIARGGN
jgi:hypothetical protein